MIVLDAAAAVTADWIVEYCASAQEPPEFDVAPVVETYSVVASPDSPELSPAPWAR